MTRTEQKLIQSYVVERWFVSTAYRRASTVEESWYYETLVWFWEKDTKKRGEWVEEHAAYGLRSAMQQHKEICQRLAETVIP